MPGTGTPQPQAANGSAMFALKNAFGFVDDAEPVASAATAAPVASSWLGGKGKKSMQSSPPLPTHEPEVSLWEHVTQQKAKTRLAAGGLGSGVLTSPSPSPPPPVPAKADKASEKEKAMDNSSLALAGKKQNKKQRQASVKKGGNANDEVLLPEAEPEPETIFLPSPLAASTNGHNKFASHAAGNNNDHENGPDTDVKGVFAMPSKVRGGPPVTTIGRQRLNSISNSGGRDTEAGSASTPRPASKIPAHLQSLAATMSTPPPFGLKPLINGAAQVQQPTERPGTGIGMNSSTIRARGASAVPAWGSASAATNSSGTHSGGGSTGRSLWGLFGGGSSETASKPQVEGWGSAHNVADEEDVDIELGKDGVGIGGGDDDWTPISRGSAQPEAQAAPVSLTQRLGHRGSEALAPQPTPEPSRTTPAVSAAAKKANGKKGAKGKKVLIEEVPDDETDNRGETLPVDSRHIFDEAEPGVILEPKPSVPPGTYDSIISYTDEESERKPAQPGAGTAPAPDEDWMTVAAKELKEAAAKKAATTGSEGAWGSNVSKTAPAATVVLPPEEVKAPQEPVSVAAKGGKQTATSTGAGGGKGKKKGKGR